MLLSLVFERISNIFPVDEGVLVVEPTDQRAVRARSDKRLGVVVQRVRRLLLKRSAQAATAPGRHAALGAHRLLVVRGLHRDDRMHTAGP